MARGVEPKAPAGCDNAGEKLIDCGRRIGANSAPTWFPENGERDSGALALQDMRKLLDAASARRR